MKILNPSFLNDFDYLALGKRITEERVKYTSLKKELLEKYPVKEGIMNVFGDKDLRNISESDELGLEKIEEILKRLEAADEASGKLMNNLSVASTYHPSPD